MLFRKKSFVSLLVIILLVTMSLLSGCAKSTSGVVAEVNGTKIDRKSVV